MIIDKHGDPIEVADLIEAPEWHGIVLSFAYDTLTVEEIDNRTREHKATRAVTAGVWQALDVEVVDA